MSKKRKQEPDRSEEDKKFPLPVYKKEMIFIAAKKKSLLEEEGPPGKRKAGKSAKNPGEDLDVPGAELDDADEVIGEEDEENNYYSLGGDDHDDLEEDKG
jgi:hypothetical protein